MGPIMNFNSAGGLLQYQAQQGYWGQTASPPIYYNQEQKDKSIMKAFRDYLEQHKNMIFTVVLALLADHYVFNGIFREKIKSLINKLLDKAHCQIDGVKSGQ